MTAEYPPAKPRHGDQPEEEPRPPQEDVERETPPSKGEAGMSKGRNYPSAPPENQGAFEPGKTRTPQSGGPD